MKFEVVNDKGITTMSTEYVSCIPDEDQLSSMTKAGFKFKIDGKPMSQKKIKDFISNNSNL